MNHREAWDLIPWLANGSIDDAGRERVEKHLAGCGECRAELRAQRALLEAMNAGPQVEAMPPASLHKLWARIDAEPAPWTRRPPARERRRGALLRWQGIAAGLAVLLLGAVLFAVLPDRVPAQAPYQTVTDPVALPADAAIRAVFAGDTPLAELQALLQGAGLRIIGGPTASGVYTLQALPGEADAEAALGRLRAHPAVRFAEPVNP